MAGQEMNLDERVGPFEGRIDADLIRHYAEATSDPNPLYRDAAAVPPVAIVTQIFQANVAAQRAAVPAEVWQASLSGVHGQQDVVLHRPIVPGETLTSYAQALNGRPTRDNLRVTVAHTTFGGDGHLVAEQWWTTVLLGTSCPAAGPDTPDHSFPESAREHPGPEHVMHIDNDMARRYAEMSGDFSDHHFDVEAARRSGYESVFIHGLCTMALCAQAVVETVAGGDPRRVRRLAVRFAYPAFPGNDLSVQLYEAGRDAFAFEAHCAGATVITNGRAELVSQ